MQLGHVGVAAVPSHPKVEFRTFAKGWAAGAAKGGGLGMIEGLMGALTELHHNPPSGQFAGLLTLITLSVATAVGTAVYGVAGGREAVPSRTAEQIEQDLKRAIGDISLANELAEKMCAFSASRKELDQYTANPRGVSLAGTSAYGDLSRQGITTIVEVQFTEAGFQGGRGSQPRVRFYLNARTRLLATATGLEMYTRDFQYQSRERLFAEWFSDGSRELLSAIRKAMDTLAERIVDELFIVTKFPFDSGLWAFPGQPEFGSCWFRPIYPELTYTSLWYAMRHNAPGIHIRYTVVDSLQPLLSWEAFPRPRDLKPENTSVLSKISDVTYDLKIWDVVDDYPERLVYDIHELQEPQYRPDLPLKPGTKFFWTFRARYKLAGQSQVTRWAFSSVPSNVSSDYPQRHPGGSCDLDAIPGTNYFRFMTP